LIPVIFSMKYEINFLTIIYNSSKFQKVKSTDMNIFYVVAH
jgi:hypothetical protein